MPEIHPHIAWAQRSSSSDAEKNVLYLTIQSFGLQGEPDLKVESNKIEFSGKGEGDVTYKFALDLYAPIVPAETKKSITERSVRLILRKEKLDAEYWPRLTEQKGKNSRISTDFSLYVDEDEQEGAAGVDESEFGGMGGGMPGGMDMASMMGGMGGGMGGGMPGMPGMGGMGGPGGMDMEALMKQFGGGAGGAGGMPDFGDDDDEGDEEAGEKMPELEEVSESK